MNDLIKREDAIKAINLRMRIPHDVASAQYASMAINAICSVPSADRPQGEWIDAEIPLESGGSMPIQACNLCKTFYPLAHTGGGYRFCPNCGARMKGADYE